MDNTQILTKVKEMLSIGANNQLDNLLSGYILACKKYMINAGVKEITDEMIPTIAIGVSNLWKDGVLSEFFHQSVMQFRVTNNE